MKHTPGPWIADDIYIMAGRKNVSVAVVDISGDAGGAHIIPHNEARANAQLIAAVPDFLAACEDFDAALMVLESVDPTVFDLIDNYLSENIIDLRKAIAKATPDTDD